MTEKVQYKYDPHQERSDIRRGIIRIQQTFVDLPKLLTPALADSAHPFQWRGGRNGSYFVDSYLVEDISIRIHKDKARFRYFHDIDELDSYKVGGFYMYWIARLRPVVYRYQPGGERWTKTEAHLNEILAIVAGITRADETNRFKAIPKRIFDELIYNLRYHKLSSDDLILQLRLLLP